MVQGHPLFQSPLLKPGFCAALRPKQPPFAYVPPRTGHPPAGFCRTTPVQLLTAVALGQFQPVPAKLLQQLLSQKAGSFPFRPEQAAKISPKTAPMVQRSQVTALARGQGRLVSLVLVFRKGPPVASAVGVLQS